MKNVFKSIFFAVVFFSAKTSMSQLNIGAQTATKIITQAVLPVVNAATTQKVISQATTNIATKVAGQTQAAVQAAQGQAANVSGQVSSSAQTAVQAGQSQAASINASGVSASATDALTITDNKNGGS